jgi:NADH:ubiquinone oxidoreductase subunit 6 (subunit J)
MIFLIIYIGAISILFLFVIMMFNLKDLHRIKKPETFYYSIYWFCLLFVSKFYLTISTYFTSCINHSTYLSGIQSVFNYDVVNVVRLSQDIFIVGNNLYTGWGILFILLGFVLLAAMVGAIILALLTNMYYTKE